MPAYPLDHVGVIVEDLDSAAAVFTELGFTVTGRSDHPFGTSNRLIMLPDLYVELVTVTDSGAVPPDGFARFVADALAAGRTGPMVLVLRTTDPAETRRDLIGAGLAAPEPVRFGRLARLADGEERWVEFIIIPTDLGSARLSAFFCRHLNPEIVWHPATLEHPNRATGLLSVSVPDPGPASWERLSRLAGVNPGSALGLGPVTIKVGPPTLVFRAARASEATLGTMTVELAP